MNMITMTGIAVIAAAFSILLKKKHPEYAMVLSLAAGIWMMAVLIGEAVPLFQWIGELVDSTGMGTDYTKILFKALGICFITQIACDSCKDLGETAIAAKLETAGKIAVLLISLPLFQRVLDIVKELMA